MAKLDLGKREDIASSQTPIFLTKSKYMADTLRNKLKVIAFPVQDYTHAQWENKDEIELFLAGQDVVFVGDAECYFNFTSFRSVHRKGCIRTPEDVEHALDDDYKPDYLREKKTEKNTITEPLFQDILSNRSIKVAWNELSSEIEISFPLSDDWFQDKDKGIDMPTAAHVLRDRLRPEYAGVSLEWVENSLLHLAKLNRYNPMADFIKNKVWDGVDRLPQVFDILGLSAADKTSRTLVHLWLKQGIALFFNTAEKRIGGEAVLVLVGKQGYGKTTFFEHLAMRPEWFRAGQSISSLDKDNARRALTTGICELGEIETTMKKADSEALKNFITQSFDEYRLPYGQSDIKSPRHTLLAGTANSDDFLVDITGNRRFWTVPLTRRIPREELKALDAAQLWAQIYQQTYTGVTEWDSACFRPDDETRDALELRNSQHRKMQKGEAEVRDILDSINDGDRGAAASGLVTVTAWKRLFPELDKYSSAQIGKCLSALGFDKTRHSAGFKYLLPYPQNLSSLVKK